MHKTRTFTITTNEGGYGEAYDASGSEGGSLQNLAVVSDDSTVITFTMTVSNPGGSEYFPFSESSITPNGEPLQSQWNEFDLDGALKLQISGQPNTTYTVYVGILTFGKTEHITLVVPDGETEAFSRGRTPGGMLMAYASEDGDSGSYTIVSRSEHFGDFTVAEGSIGSGLNTNDWSPLPNGHLEIAVTGAPADGVQHVHAWIVS